MKLSEIIEKVKENVSDYYAFVIQDSDGHYAMLYLGSPGKIAMQFQEHFSPFVYPEPEYSFVGQMPVEKAVVYVAPAKSKQASKSTRRKNE